MLSIVGRMRLPFQRAVIQCRKLSEFQAAKVLHEFDNVFDRNHDGLVCRLDIKDLKRLLDNYYSVNTGTDISKGHAAFYNKYHDFWILFTELADENGDGVISREEWLHMWQRINEKSIQSKGTKPLPMWLRLLPSAIFPLIDTKGDGVIDFEEFQAFWKYVIGEQDPVDTTKVLFEKMSEDGKIPINLNRFEHLYADYYLSDDKNSPSRYIIGARRLF